MEPLAAVLRAASDEDLIRGLELRGVTAGGIRDFFDLAESLLAESSLQDCLTRLDRRSLAALIHLSEQPIPADELREAHELEPNELQRLHNLFLVHATPEGVATWPEVGRQLATWAALGLPDPRINAEWPGTDSAGTNDIGAVERSNADRLAAEHAFTATTTVAELLFDLEREPLRLLATGGIGRPGAKRLTELLKVDEPTARSAVDIAEQAGLAARRKGNLRPTGDHRDWLERGPAERWVLIADAWAEAHWPYTRSRISKHQAAHGTSLRDWLNWNYPGGRDWLPEEATVRLAEAELLGITAHNIISTSGSQLLLGNIDSAQAILSAALPAPIERLYLQHDLTAVAPGPLQPRIDTRLRSMADVDGHSIASRYRFTKASISRAIAGDETAASILEFLGGISLSGIPQPLEYLVTETASRHGLLRVGPLPTGDPQAVSYARSNDPVLLRTVLIDRNLAVLRMLPRDNETLVSSSESGQLYAVLHDAHYPVAFENSHGRIIEPRPTASSGSPTKRLTAKVAPHPQRALVARVRAADANAPEDSGEAWLARQLDSAIRSKSTVTVSVRMPNGKVVDYRLEPASVSGGRLRARDPHSEIERTLPLSSIAAVSDA